MDDPKIDCVITGVEDPAPVYNKRQRLIGYNVVLNMRLMHDCQCINPFDEHVKAVASDEIVKVATSKGYNLVNKPRIEVSADGMMHFQADFRRDQFFRKQLLFDKSHELATSFAVSCRKVMVMLHKGKTNEK